MTKSDSVARAIELLAGDKDSGFLGISERVPDALTKLRSGVVDEEVVILLHNLGDHYWSMWGSSSATEHLIASGMDSHEARRHAEVLAPKYEEKMSAYNQVADALGSELV